MALQLRFGQPLSSQVAMLHFAVPYQGQRWRLDQARRPAAAIGEPVQQQDADRNFKPFPQASLVRVGGLVQAAPKAQVRLHPALPQAGPGIPF